jgi:hypothetical protein
MVAGAPGVGPSLYRVLVALCAVVVGVVFGGGAMRPGRILVERRSPEVCSIGHDRLSVGRSNAGPTQGARIVFRGRPFVDFQLQPFCFTGFGNPAKRYPRPNVGY